jgi:hypothetical protein
VEFWAPRDRSPPGRGVDPLLIEADCKPRPGHTPRIGDCTEGTLRAGKGREIGHLGVAVALSSPTVSDAPIDMQITGEVPAPEKNIILDEFTQHLDSLRVLRAHNPEEASALLASLGASGKAEADIVDQLAKTDPLWLPDRFEEAHRMVMRALEVIDRNGPRVAKLPKMGPLKPIAEWAVQLFTRLIVRNYQHAVIDKIRHLYSRREANSVWGSREHHMLRRARIDAERVAPGLKGQALGLPTFLFGGAVLSSVLGFLGNIAKTVSAAKELLIIAAVVMAVLFACLSWVTIYSAAVARRRAKLTLDKPLAALFETIGACGTPPRDDSFTFATYALVLTALAFVVIPIGIGLAILRGPDKKAPKVVTPTATTIVAKSAKLRW